jgi:hypothetical protein
MRVSSEFDKKAQEEGEGLELEVSPEPELDLIEDEEIEDEDEEYTGKTSADDARQIGENIGIDWDQVDFTPDDFAVGVDLEFDEHGPSNPETDVTGGDIAVAAKIAWAHLEESDKYYDLLIEMEEKF